LVLGVLMKSSLHQSLTVNVDGEKKDILSSSSICPVCKYEGGEGNNVYNFGDVAIVRCPKCNVMHLSPMPDEMSLLEIYNNNYYKDPTQEHGYFDYASEAGAIKKTYARRVEFFKEKVGSKMESLKSFHEIGCALGIGLSEIKRILAGNVSGSDISKDSKVACEELGVDFFLSDSKGAHLINGEKKGAVFIFDVIEHLSDIPSFVSFLDDFVQDSGYLIITTPNMKDIFNRVLGARSPSIKIPQHTIYFDTNTLSSALQGSFELIHQRRDYQYISIARLVERVLHVFKINRKFSMSLKSEVMVPNGMSIYIFKKRVLSDD
jgi:2-polyprenyl-3-methyl-5-hydroxy-6-metoxy-1,4-benzoquinol methylase